MQYCGQGPVSNYYYLYTNIPAYMLMQVYGCIISLSNAINYKGTPRLNNTAIVNMNN